MGKMEIHTAPYSMIAADHCASLSGRRFYVQLPDNTIQEFGYSGLLILPIHGRFH